MYWGSRGQKTSSSHGGSREHDSAEQNKASHLGKRSRWLENYGPSKSREAAKCHIFHQTDLRDSENFCRLKPVIQWLFLDAVG